MTRTRRTARPPHCWPRREPATSPAGPGSAPPPPSTRARQAGDPILLLGALDVMTNALNDEARTRDANEVVAERLRLVADLPRHDPAAATEITDTFHVAIAGALAAGDLPAAAELVDRASSRDPLAEHPYVTTPRTGPCPHADGPVRRGHGAG